MRSAFRIPVLNLTASEKDMKSVCMDLIRNSSVATCNTLAALQDVCSDAERYLGLGDILTTCGLSPSFTIGNPSSTIKSSAQVDYEKVLALGVAPHFTLVHKILEYMDANLFLAPPQPMTIYPELMRATLNETDLVDYSMFMRVLKYSKQAMSYEVVERSDHHKLEWVSQVLDLPLTKSEPRHSYPRILACRYGTLAQMNLDCFSFLQRSYSSLGLTYTFNSHSFWSMYKRNPYSEQFYHEINAMRYKPKVSVPLHVTNYGPASALELHLSLPILEQHPDVLRKFSLSVHPPGDAPDLASQALLISPGKIYTLVVTPKQVDTELDVEALPLSSRNCLFPSESSGLSLFLNYTQSGCILECKLKLAHDSCGCTPWDFPQPPSHQISLCNMSESVCFSSALSLEGAPGQCDCPPSCQETEYPYTLYSEPIEWESICLGRHSGFHPEVKNLVFFTAAGMRNDLENRFEMCRRTMEKVAVVRIYVGSSAFHRVTRSRRVTFVGQLSNIGRYYQLNASFLQSYSNGAACLLLFLSSGGILSLFTGMSILSVCEMIFWLIKIASSVVPCKGK